MPPDDFWTYVGMALVVLAFGAAIWMLDRDGR